ncbi:hypothetical protein CBL_00292 [Carabus blaptoides fortunei]
MPASQTGTKHKNVNNANQSGMDVDKTNKVKYYCAPCHVRRGYANKPVPVTYVYVEMRELTVGITAPALAIPHHLSGLTGNIFNLRTDSPVNRTKRPVTDVTA